MIESCQPSVFKPQLRPARYTYNGSPMKEMIVCCLYNLELILNAHDLWGAADTLFLVTENLGIVARQLRRHHFLQRGTQARKAVRSSEILESTAVRHEDG